LSSLIHDIANWAMKLIWRFTIKIGVRYGRH